jgi:hypothetical protein
VRKHALASLLLGLLLSGAGMWYALRGVDLVAMVQGMGRIGALWVIGSVAAGLFSLVLRAIRWRFLLDASRPVGVGPLVSATFIGIMANNLLPARLGEAVRAWVLAKHQRRPVPTVFASILVERLLDVIMLLILFGFAMFASPALDSGTVVRFRATGLVVLGAVTLGLVALALAVRYRARLAEVEARWVEEQKPAWRCRLIGLVHRFVEGLWVLRGITHMLVVAALSVCVWGASIASFQVLADGFDLGLTITQTTLVFGIVAFGIAIPSAPGFIGTFHGFCVAGLTLVAGTDSTTALAYATVLHGSQWLTINVIGLGYLLALRSVAWPELTRLLRRGPSR